SVVSLFFFFSTSGEFGFFFFFQAEDGIRGIGVTGVQTCALPISRPTRSTATVAGSDERLGGEALRGVLGERGAEPQRQRGAGHQDGEHAPRQRVDRGGGYRDRQHPAAQLRARVGGVGVAAFAGAPPEPAFGAAPKRVAQRLRLLHAGRQGRDAGDDPLFAVDQR